MLVRFNFLERSRFGSCCFTFFSLLLKSKLFQNQHLLPLQKQTAETLTDDLVVLSSEKFYHFQTVTPQLLKQPQLYLFKLLDFDNAGHNLFVYPSTLLVYLPLLPSSGSYLLLYTHLATSHYLLLLSFLPKSNCFSLN